VRMRRLVVLGVGLVLGLGAAAGGAAGQAALTLNEAMATALERNEALRTADRGLDAARAQVREAWGSVMPNVHFTGSYTRNLDLPQFFLPARFLDPTAPPDAVMPVRAGSDNAWLAQARLEQPLFNAAAFLGVGAADRYASYQEEVVRGEAQEAVTRTRLRYYEVLLAREQVRLTSESVARVEQVLDETRQLQRAGLASEYDVLRLDVELANLEPNLRRARNAMASARRALAVEMGMEEVGRELAGSLLTVELPALPAGAGAAEPASSAAGSSPAGSWGAGSSAAGVAVVRSSVAGASGVASSASSSSSELVPGRSRLAERLSEPEVVALAHRYRSDLRQVEQMRELRRTERRVEMSQYLPRVALFGTWTVNAQGDDAPTFFGEHRFSTRALGIQVDVPVFSGFQRPARVSRMGAVVQQLDAQLAYARELAANEVVTLRDQALEAYDRVVAQRRAVSQATRGWDIAQSEYRAGMVGRLQVTDAELALRQTEFNYAQAVYDYLTAQARLDQAIGRVPLVDDASVVAFQGSAGER
jgi:outer membrane protein